MANNAPTPTTFEEANKLGIEIGVKLAQLTNAGCLSIADCIPLLGAMGEGIALRFGDSEDEPNPDAIKADVEEAQTDG